LWLAWAVLVLAAPTNDTEPVPGAALGFTCWVVDAAA
jgi:hypothetical protein